MTFIVIVTEEYDKYLFEHETFEEALSSYNALVADDTIDALRIDIVCVLATHTK